MTAQEIVFDGLSFGMKIVGDMYERNERFVTDMLKAAKTMDKAMTESPAVPWVG
jgi:methanogenic corrinoid protein MtbC1